MAKDFMDDPFYKQIVGKCEVCKRDVQLAESHECEQCRVIYCMYCVVYDVDKKSGISGMLYCPKGHFIASAVMYETDEDLQRYT